MNRKGLRHMSRLFPEGWFITADYWIQPAEKRTRPGKFGEAITCREAAQLWQCTQRGDETPFRDRGAEINRATSSSQGLDQEDSVYPQNTLQQAAGAYSGLALVVEEDEQVRGLIALILNRLGFSTLLARTAREALAFIEEYQERIQITVLEVHLTGICGREIFERLRSQGNNSPVLFTSSFNRNQMKEEFPDQNDFGILLKPWTAKELVHMIESLWQKQP